MIKFLMINFLACLLSITMIAGIANSQDNEASGQENGSKAIQEKITALSLEWQKLAAAKDAKGFTSYFTTNAIAFAPGAPVAVGTDEILQSMVEYFALSGLKLSWVTTSVEVSESGDMAVERGHFTETMDDDKGKLITRTGKFATTWVKTSDGSWKARTDSNGYDK
jgi:uncharacterized protein (TIGR02246 family)